MLNISKLSVSVASKKILSDISFNINQGDVLAIIGPNGAGKSTLLKSILSLYRSCGSVIFSNQSIKELSPNERAKLIAYLSQNTSMSFNFNCEEVVRLGAYPYRKDFSQTKINQKIKRAMQLTDVFDLMGRDYFSLSGGEKQRIQLARVLVQLNLLEDNQPKLLLLDEHVSHLDLLHQHKILSMIKNFSKNNQLTVVMVLHDINQVLTYADKVAVIYQGKLFDFGCTKDVVTKPMIKNVYQMKLVEVTGYDQGIFLPMS